VTDWRPSSGARAAESRAAMLRRLRVHFESSGVLEVDTPSLSPYAVSDTQIESFAIPESQVSRRPLFLQTSPEFCMKRLLADGYPDIYSICRVFRDGEIGRRHQPEFTMVEWYRRDLGLPGIVDDTLSAIAAALGDRAPQEPAAVIDYRDAFFRELELDAVHAPIQVLADAADADDALRAAIGDERDDWLDLLMATRIVPTFAADRLTVVQHYPASQAALARLCPADVRLADRFEVFCGDLELANGYVELTDAAEQRARIDRDNENRRRRGRAVRPVDTRLLAALAAGLPACAGVAMGLERLQMVHDRTEDMRDVVTFAFDDNAR
jgi:lysyl-tRNA synthetase class 2